MSVFDVFFHCRQFTFSIKPLLRLQNLNMINISFVKVKSGRLSEDRLFYDGFSLIFHSSIKNLRKVTSIFNVYSEMLLIDGFLNLLNLLISLIDLLFMGLG